MAGVQRGKFDDRFVRSLAAPERGNRIAYERGNDAVRGFGVRVTAAGAKSFVLNYTVARRERRLTIGAYPAWSVAAAPGGANALRRQSDAASGPLGTREAEREAPNVSDLCDRYIAEHASRKRTGTGDEAMIRGIVRPELGSRKVAAI